MRTKEEIERQVNGLKAMKEWLPERSHFGDNNWENIDYQIDILEGVVTVEDLEQDFGGEIDNDAVYQAVVDAEDWLDGITNDDLFEEKP